MNIEVNMAKKAIQDKLESEIKAAAGEAADTKSRGGDRESGLRD